MDVIQMPTSVSRLTDRSDSVAVSDALAKVKELVLAKGYVRREAPFQLASGEWSHDYIDGKRALSNGRDLRMVAECITSIALDTNIVFDAVGGLTMGADAIAHAVAMNVDKQWFSVRKESKTHGKKSLVEGAELGPDSKVILVDDVVSTGGSILQALDAIKDSGAEIVLAVTLVDRGESAAGRLASRAVPYRPLLTFRDIGIDPVRG